MSRTCLNTGEWSNEDMECSSERKFLCVG
jgi:hypothetical protein